MIAQVDVKGQVPLLSKHFLISGVGVLETSFWVADGIVIERGPRATSTAAAVIVGLSQRRRLQLQVAAVMTTGISILFTGFGYLASEKVILSL